MWRKTLKLALLGLTGLIWTLALGLMLTASTLTTHTTYERARLYAVGREFDFVTWTVQALAVKLQPTEQARLSEAEQSQRVRAYLALRRDYQQVEADITRVYAESAEPFTATVTLRARRDQLNAALRAAQPLAEAILQAQLTGLLRDNGLTVWPPVAFHFTPLPLALILSPRDDIRREASVMLVGDLTLEEQIALETIMAERLNLSALVTPVGGIGVYPTMVIHTSHIPTVADIVAHEWAHNYLFFHPLGLNLDASPALWTMNETTASLFGRDLMKQWLARHYPEAVPPATTTYPNRLPRQTAAPAPGQPTAPAFDFNAEMRETRVRADELLAQGRIDEAETYMEARRQRLVQNGYPIRRLNQAYFAFYGSYASSAGGGAQGVDPVGPAVQLVHRRSGDVAEFLRTMAQFGTWEHLQAHLAAQSASAYASEAPTTR